MLDLFGGHTSGTMIFPFFRILVLLTLASDNACIAIRECVETDTFSFSLQNS